MKRAIGWMSGDKDVTLNNHATSKRDDGKNKVKSCWSYFKEFTDNTSLHGLKYIGEGRRSVIEKIWWTAMFILSSIACGHLIYNVWTKWEENPVIVSFAETPTPVWQVPFPAVTICPEIKSRKDLFNYTDMFHRFENNNLTKDELKRYESFALMCNSHNYNPKTFETDKEFVEKDFTQYLFSVAPEFDETFIMCKWKEMYNFCNSIFTPILTEEGLCYSFNMLTSDELLRNEELHNEFNYMNGVRKSKGWTLDNGYPEEESPRTYPYRGTPSGMDAGLTLTFKVNRKDLDHLCRGPQGFKVILHNPSEYPLVSKQFFRVPLNQEIIAAVKPNMMTTSEGLRNYNPNRRQCYFPPERRLKYFKIYTQQNCEWECLTNYTKEACGCVYISMPRNASTPVCSVRQSNCVVNAREDLLTREVTKKIKILRHKKVSNRLRSLNKIADQCRCLPECTAITYDTETSQVDFNFQNIFQAFRIEDNITKDIIAASVKIYFRDSQFIGLKRSELFGQTDFFANCGGLLGLFLGFSFLSFIEIVYFFTLRLLCNIKKKAK